MLGGAFGSAVGFRQGGDTAVSPPCYGSAQWQTDRRAAAHVICRDDRVETIRLRMDPNHGVVQGFVQFGVELGGDGGEPVPSCMRILSS